MSDHSISIVPKRTIYPNNKDKANEILEWLVLKAIIEPIPSDCTLGSENGYAVSNGAKQVTNYPKQLPFNLSVNGLEIVTDLQVFDTAGNGLEELICSNCKNDISTEDYSFFEDWIESNGQVFTCPKCKWSGDIQRFKFTPEWGFSNLGFRFWNWPKFTDEFIKEFEQKLSCNLSVVYQKI